MDQAMMGAVSAATLKVSPEELIAQSERIRRYRSELQRLLMETEDKINGSGSFWIGEGGDTLRMKYQAKKETVEEILNRFEEHIRELQEMAGVYKEAEERAATLADSLPAHILL